MKPPNSYQEVQKMTGCLAALNHFISKSDERNLPFFKNLRPRKLKAYFESHPFQVVTDQHLKRVLSNPALSGRLTTWSIELSKFEISYVLRTSIRAQVLADFVTECTARPPPIIKGPRVDDPSLPKPNWALYVDGARNDKGQGHEC
ncbi:hypothetical protein LIER_31287 [Lithospermum erythrorhizon]|uniref:Reverse transcriptase RNase H-like domain-containing protein n=1 Tax=Lithospermum erythrorhizon TaxID=34254 RepID=A0AAV3RU70_LITER